MYGVVRIQGRNNEAGGDQGEACRTDTREHRNYRAVYTGFSQPAAWAEMSSRENLRD